MTDVLWWWLVPSSVLFVGTLVNPSTGGVTPRGAVFVLAGLCYLWPLYLPAALVLVLYAALVPRGETHVTDADAFLAAIRETPADDLPRLVYADWLEEHDEPDRLVPCPRCSEYAADPNNPWGVGYHLERDPASGRHEGGWTNCQRCHGGGFVREGNGFANRAEFIRAQCDLARSKPCSAVVGPTRGMPKPGWHLVGGCEHCDLRRRERGLWGRYEDSPMREVLRRESPVLRPMNVVIDSDVTPGSQFGVPLATVRRGFVAEVRCRLMDWLGGPYPNVRPDGPCDIVCSCQGSGRLPALGPRVVAAPGVVLERVEVTDREPLERLGEGNRFRWWMPHPAGGRTFDTSAYVIPRPVFDLLTGPHKEWADVTPDDWCWEYESSAAAFDALSAALIALAWAARTGVPA